MTRSQQILAFFREVAPTMTQKEIVNAVVEKFECGKPTASAYISDFKKKYSIMPLGATAVAVAPAEKPVVKPIEVKQVIVTPALTINEIDIACVPRFLVKSWEKHM